MAEVRLIGRKGSKACKAIVEESDINRFLRRSNADFLVNYGLAGKHMRAYLERMPRAAGIPTINRNLGRSKYTVVKMVGKNGVLVPDTKKTLGAADHPKDFIEKKLFSAGGVGIKRATKKGAVNNKYYQRFISDRRYELRVHAFRWQDPTTWRVSKRLGDHDAIAWNYKQGGYFQTVNNPQGYKVFRDAIEISDDILKMLDMGFGAVDFVVTNDGEIYFLEVNSAPGFEELNKHIYIEAFNDLVKTSVVQLRKLACK
jgi:glutathione synthase/RimK-type ligase-like ATP-grasp enzyme